VKVGTAPQSMGTFMLIASENSLGIKIPEYKVNKLIVGTKLK